MRNGQDAAGFDQALHAALLGMGVRMDYLSD